MLTSVQAVSLIGWMTLTPYLIVTVVFYLNRDKYPIKGRSPRVAIGQAVFLFLFATGQFIMNTFGVPCDAGTWIIFFSGLWTHLCFNYRLLVLLFNYEITQNISELKDNRKLGDLKLNWFTSHRYIAQDRFIIRLAIAIFIFDFIVLLAFTTLAERTCGNPLYGIIFSVRGAPPLVLSVVMSLKMWKYPTDAFGIKTEFRWMISGAVGIFVIFYLIAIVNPDLQWIAEVGMIYACQPMIFCTVVVPYYKTTKQKQFTGEDVQTLESWLTRPEGIKKFREYLEIEFSSENLLFYLDVVYFKTLPLDNPGAIKDEITQIYDKFFVQSSPCAVNLPSNIIETTGNAVQNLLSIPLDELSKMPKEDVFTVFDEAQREIYRLMASDSFHRFQQTSTFQQIKDTLTKSLQASQGSHGTHESKQELDKLLGSQDGVVDVVSQMREENTGVRTPSKSIPNSPSMVSLELSGRSIAETENNSSTAQPIVLEKIIDVNEQN